MANLSIIRFNLEYFNYEAFILKLWFDLFSCEALQDALQQFEYLGVS